MSEETRQWDLVLDGPNMTTYTGTKTIGASQEITKRDYCRYRGWDLPADEDGEEIGRIVEYPQPEGKKGNHPKHVGYISWSPKFAFDAAYRPSEKWDDRLKIEHEDLKNKVDKLSAFLAAGPAMVSEENIELLGRQLEAMSAYMQVLEERLA